MNYIVFDIETRNTFDEVGSPNPEDLDISVVSVYDSKTDAVTSYLQEELDNMWPLFEKTEAIIGYNSDHFDIPLLNKYYSGDLGKIKSIDLLKDIRKSYGKRIKLDDVANATLGKNKIAHGLEAVKWWKQGKIDDIIKYCEEDVIITHQVFLHAKEHGFIKFKDFGGNLIEIKIDTSDWKPAEKEPAMQSLF